MTLQKKAFTLVEIVVAITILSMVMITVFEAYSNILALNKRLELGRILQKNARDVTEAIAKDVRSAGIDPSFYTDATERNGYTASGNTILAVRPQGGYSNRYYLMQDDSVLGHPVACKILLKANCFLGKEIIWPAGSQYIRLTDNDVRLTSLAFYISWESTSSYLTSDALANEWKVTLDFSMEIASNRAVSEDLREASRLNLQTTISEKLYKSY